MSQPVRDPTLNDFDPVSREEWLALVERDLKGAPFRQKLVRRVSGIDVEPLYTQAVGGDRAGVPGLPPYTRGSRCLGHVQNGWDVRQAILQPDPAEAARAIREELQGGATSVLLRFDDATRTGSETAGTGGINCANLADLEQVLECLALDKTAIGLDAGTCALPLAAGLFALADKRGIDARTLRGSLGADPLSELASTGTLASSLERALTELATLALYTHTHAPGLRSVTVHTAVYHDAGADAATELAIALATGLTYLRALTERGLTVDEAAQQLTFHFSIGRDFFLEIAKLRAARTCWARVVSASGGAATAPAMLLHAATSERTKTVRDPWVNLLRATAETFSAAVGGADVITTGGFDTALGASDAFARHLARNTQHLLRHEAHLHRVVDAAGGSFYLESLTTALAQAAWHKLQALERGGPLGQQLIDGSVQATLRAALAADEQAVASRRIAITGVNEFPNVREARLERPAPDVHALTRHTELARAKGKRALAALGEHPTVETAIVAIRQGAAFLDVRDGFARGSSPKTTAPALTRARLAQPFEVLRDDADRMLAARGQRPRVFLANLGPIADHKARAQFAQNVLEAGGFEALGNDGFPSAEAAASAFAASRADLCALCSSDKVYAALAIETARAVSAHGPKALVLAGHPGEQEASYREAGITHFMFAGMNVVDSLRSLLGRAGAA